MTVKQDIHIVICGDLCVRQDTAELFEAGNAPGLFKGLMEPFTQADLLIGNLEFPLTDIGKGIEKCGPVFKGTTKCITALSAAGFNILGLANNHIRDCGDEGVLSTLATCRKARIQTVGAGEDVDVARKPVLANVSGWNICVMAFAEHEFNAAGENRAGANLFDPYESLDEIRELRKECDYLILLYHGGVEHYAYPSPMLQKKCRKMVDCGADLVLCQHSHCVGTKETYKDGTILYGQGNTAFGYRANDQSWNEGLLVKVSLTDKAKMKPSVNFIPVAAYPDGLNLMPPEGAKQLLEAFSQRSQQIVDAAFIQNSWKTFCRDKQALYLPLLLGLGRVVNFLNRKLNNRIITLFFANERLRGSLNLVRCESHHEVVESILQNRVGSD